MADVDDVAAYILDQTGPLTAMKLQKLVYYSHAWHLVWDEKPLFSDRIEAWANGPVVRSLYAQHRGHLTVNDWPTGHAENLTRSERESIDAVLGFYGEMSAHELSELTHRERPWQKARKGVPEGRRCDVAIKDSDMFEYYDGLTSSAD